MLIRVNDREVFVSDGTTVQGLIELGRMDPAKIVVELNRAVLAREQWPSTALEEGDALEVVSFVGGG